MAFSEHLLRIGVKTTTPDPLGFRLKASIGNDAGPVPSRRPLPATRRAGGPIDGPARSVRLCDADTPIILARTALQSPRTENVSGVQPPTHDGIPPMVIDRPERSCLLTINGGSSSLKFALFPRTPGAIEGPLLKGQVERIGLAGSKAVVEPATGGETRTTEVDAPDLRAAAGWVIDWLDANVGWAAIAGIAHRVVHGGPHYVGPETITDDVLDELRRISPMDPDHLPGEIAVIERFRARLPAMPQMACFDTAFHHDLPRVARIVPIPRRFEAAGVRRYGFHGLSYAYLMEALAAAAGPEAASGRVILAHLGNGASLAAVHRGKPVDTTMALTPAAGRGHEHADGRHRPRAPRLPRPHGRGHDRAVRRHGQP